MEQRALEVTVLSAKNLNNLNLIGKMDVYIIVSISGNKSTKVKTPVDVDGGSNPAWNFQTRFIIDEVAAQHNNSSIVFKVKCERALGDKDIGEVNVPIKELLQAPEAADGKKQFVSYQVMKPDGKPKGFINFAYQFGEKVKQGEQYTTMAYPQPPGVGGSSSTYPQSTLVYPPPPGGSYPPPPHVEGGAGYPRPHYSEGGAGYPPPPIHAEGGYSRPEGYPPPPKHSEGGYPSYPHSEGYPPPPKHSEGGYYHPPPPQYGGHGYQQPPAYGGYPPPPPPGYGYQPPQPGYGYAPHTQHPPKKNNKLGLGLGAGLLGGALGGLLIGDMISDGLGDVSFDF